jgi:nucleotide-binding universal stress UspA family protein
MAFKVQADTDKEAKLKIVIGYDGSKAANGTLKDLRNAGLPRAAQVRIVHAVPPLLPLDSLAPDGSGISWYAEAYKEALANRQATLNGALAQAREAATLLRGMFPSWKIRAEVVEETPAQALLGIAESWKAGLIVVGSQGWNVFGKMIVGSVADKVLNHAHCTVRLGKGVAAIPLRPPSLLIAYDGSPFAEEAIRQVAARSWPKGTVARVLAVSELQLRMGDITLALNKTLGRKGGKTSPWPWMERKLEKAVAVLEKSGIAANGLLALDEPRRAILDQAKKSKADMIFMGTHGHTGLRRFLLGSVSASVAAHAPCTVEIVRARAKRTAGSK